MLCVALLSFAFSEAAMDADILQAHQRRLRFLEIRAAEMGKDALPHILMEIEDIDRLLKKCLLM